MFCPKNIRKKALFVFRSPNEMDHRAFKQANPPGFHPVFFMIRALSSEFWYTDFSLDKSRCLQNIRKMKQAFSNFSDKNMPGTPFGTDSAAVNLTTSYLNILKLAPII